MGSRYAYFSFLRQNLPTHDIDLILIRFLSGLIGDKINRFHVIFEHVDRIGRSDDEELESELREEIENVSGVVDIELGKNLVDDHEPEGFGEFGREEIRVLFSNPVLIEESGREDSVGELDCLTAGFPARGFVDIFHEIIPDVALLDSEEKPVSDVDDVHDPVFVFLYDKAFHEILDVFEGLHLVVHIEFPLMDDLVAELALEILDPVSFLGIVLGGDFYVGLLGIGDRLQGRIDLGDL